MKPVTPQLHSCRTHAQMRLTRFQAVRRESVASEVSSAARVNPFIFMALGNAFIFPVG